MSHTADIPQGHGFVPMVVDLIVQDPDTYRKYGRRFIRGMAQTCPDCQRIDARRDRLRRMHSLAHRRRR